jgi:hypothetical protein
LPTRRAPIGLKLTDVVDRLEPPSEGGRPGCPTESSQGIIAHRLAVLRHTKEVTGNVSKTCRYYVITRTSYLPRRRDAQLGDVGLRVRSSRPHHSPRATREAVGRIVYLRQRFHFGPLKFVMTSSGPGPFALQSAVWPAV